MIFLNFRGYFVMNIEQCFIADNIVIHESLELNPDSCNKYDSSYAGSCNSNVQRLFKMMAVILGYLSKHIT
jgi:hypothetical protein